MLQHSRSGNNAFLGDVTYNDCGGTSGLAYIKDLLSALSHLTDGTGKCVASFCEDGLNGINYEIFRFQQTDLFFNPLPSIFRCNGDFFSRGAEPFRPQRNLFLTFFSRNI